MRSLVRAALAALALAVFAGPARAQEPTSINLDLRDVKVSDAVRLVAFVADMNVVTSEGAGAKRVSLVLSGVPPLVAIETICLTCDLWFKADDGKNVIRIVTTDEYRRGLIVSREEKTRVFTLLHPNALAIASGIRDIYSGRVILSLGFTEDVTGLTTYNNFFFSPGGGFLNQAGGGFGGQQGAGFGGGFGNQLGGGFGGGFGNQLGGGFGNQFGGGFGNQLGGGFGGGGFGGGGFNQTGVFGGVNQPFRQVQQQPQQVDANGNPIGTSGQTDAQLQGLGAEKLAELSRLKAQRHANGKTGAGVTAEDVGAVSPSAEPLIYVSVNSPQNSLVIRTSDSRALDEIATLIAQLDRPVPQVLLEMKILELDLQDDFSSVFDFDYVEPVAQNPGNSIGGKQNPFLATGATAPTNVVGAGNFNLNPASTLVYQFLNERIRARVQLLERERRVNVLSTPLLLCVNHGSARLFIGEERILTRSFQATGSVIAQNTVTQPVVVPITQLRNIGKSLSIVPQINADRTVTLTVVQENSAVNPGAAVIPVPLGNGGTGQFAVDTVDTSNLAGTVVAKDGMTVAIGGLIEDRIDRREDKVPFLGDIPLLGVFFKSTDRGRRRTELMLLITPRVLLTPAEGQTVTRERLLALSIHPYQDLGDRAAQAYEKHEVPQASREHVFMRDLLAPDPEPAK